MQSSAIVDPSMCRHEWEKRDRETPIPDKGTVFEVWEECPKCRTTSRYRTWMKGP